MLIDVILVFFFTSLVRKRGGLGILNMNMEKHRYIQLLDKFHRKQCSEEEIQELKKLDASRENRDDLFKIYEERWFQAEEKLPTGVQKRMLNRIKEQIASGHLPFQMDVCLFDEKEKIQQIQSIQQKSRFSSVYMRYAAAASVALLTGFAGFLMGGKEKPTGGLYTFSVEHGQKANMVLPDGTEVWLNSKTKLRYDGSYNQKDRVLYLEGEAYFNVAKNKEKKFVVKTNELDVVALGTSFNVKANQNEDYVSVTLVEGKVQVESPEISDILTPNQHLVYDKIAKSGEKSKLHNSSHAALWRKGQLAFYDETLEDIGKALTRMYDVDIEWGSDSIKQYRFSGVIRNSSLNNVLEVLCVSAPVKYQMKNNTIRIEDLK